MIFNEQLMKQAGISVSDIKTEDDLLAAFKKVKDLKVNGAPVIPLLIDGKVYQVATLPTLQDHFGAMEVDKAGNYRDKFLLRKRSMCWISCSRQLKKATLIRVK